MSQKHGIRPVYTDEQIEQYLDYINFPKNVRISKADADTSVGVSFLTKLIKYQLACVPFENLELHYSTHHTISLDLDYLFDFIVGRRNGRGGYCMQNNAFFGCILRSLGFKVMPAGARVNSAAGAQSDDGLDQHTFGGWSHTVNIITIGNDKYFCDVGFGTRGPTGLIPLQDGVNGRVVGGDEGSTLFTLSREHINQNTHHQAEQLLWIYSIRFHEKMSWLPMYCFAEIEFLPQDFAIMSYYVSHSPTSWFTQKIVFQKYILDTTNDVVIGELTFDGQSLKERKFGKSQSLCEIKSESDRVRALETYLGVKLSQPEANGIKGLWRSEPVHNIKLEVADIQ